MQRAHLHLAHPEPKRHKRFSNLIHGHGLVMVELPAPSPECHRNPLQPPETAAVWHGVAAVASPDLPSCLTVGGNAWRRLAHAVRLHADRRGWWCTPRSSARATVPLPRRITTALIALSHPPRNSCTYGHRHDTCVCTSSPAAQCSRPLAHTLHAHTKPSTADTDATGQGQWVTLHQPGDRLEGFT